MLAGLLNLLVIYDAWAGPMRPVRPADEDGKPDETGSQTRRGPDR
jgi:hypothetical protein